MQENHRPADSNGFVFPNLKNPPVDSSRAAPRAQKHFHRIYGSARKIECQTPSMDRVEEIETAIAGLPPQEYQRLVEWFRAREQTRWDEQMDGDSAAGKLDFLFDEAERESAQGPVREWPPRK
jgi:hypothetical protein